MLEIEREVELGKGKNGVEIRVDKVGTISTSLFAGEELLRADTKSKKKDIRCFCL